MTRMDPSLSKHSEASANSGGGALSATRDGAPQLSRYSVNETPLGAPKHLRIVTIGAGASGINLIRTLRRTLPVGTFEHVVYEKNSGVGGTWHENRYPGCRCDVPSHNYQFSWRKNPEWSNFFAPAAEIQAYLSRICDAEDMWPVIKTSHMVGGARWSEEEAMWHLEITDLASGRTMEDKAHFLIDATGILNNWKWPEVPGLKDYEGDLVHTAAWPKDFKYKDATVAVIGNGASGVQLLPAIRQDVKKLFHVIRSPTAILPPRLATMKAGAMAPLLEKIELDAKENFTTGQIARFKSDPAFYETFTSALELDSNIKFVIALMKDSPQQKWASVKVKEFMTAMLQGNEALCSQLIPDYPLGCRRMTPAPGYLESFHDPRVELRTKAIKAITKRGITLADGEVLEVDAIICATGFDSSFRPVFPLIGRKGNLQDRWTKETPKSYMSLAVDGFPNYFKFLGPNAPIAHGAVFSLSEHIATYIANVIAKAQTEGIRSLAPSAAAVDDYAAHVAAFMPRTAFAGDCRSWYKQDGDGAVTGLHPGSRMHFIEMLAHFRGEDWEFSYDGVQDGGRRPNRFAYLGNGFTMTEVGMLKKAGMS